MHHMLLLAPASLHFFIRSSVFRSLSRGVSPSRSMSTIDHTYSAHCRLHGLYLHFFSSSARARFLRSASDRNRLRDGQSSLTAETFFAAKYRFTRVCFRSILVATHDRFSPSLEPVLDARSRVKRHLRCRATVHPSRFSRTPVHSKLHTSSLVRDSTNRGKHP